MRYHNQACEKKRFSVSGTSSTASSAPSSTRTSISSLDNFENDCSISEREPASKGGAAYVTRRAPPEPSPTMSLPDYAKTIRAFTMDQLRRDGLEPEVNAQQAHGGSSGPRALEATPRSYAAANANVAVNAGRWPLQQERESSRAARNSPATATYGPKKCINSASSRHYRMAPEPLCRDFAAS